MCGIAGWIDYNQDMRNKTNILDQMSETLKRRGPTDFGKYVKKNAALLHRRLAILDPKNGIQPMSYAVEERKFTIVYNGEIYNANEIRSELIDLGFTFEGKCDTEVLLKAFVCWKEECLQKLNGIFAFGVFNEHDNSLFLARDRIGVKPLFFYPYDKGLIFGSEIKTLLKNPLVEPLVDEEGLMEIFFLGPGRTPGCGIIKGIKELKPGEFLYFNEQGLNIKKYWEVCAREFDDDVDTAAEKINFLVKDAITRQLTSDVPLCCFLSGGLDSSIISKVASDYYKERGLGPLTTYSIDYKNNDKYFKKSVFQPNQDSDYINLAAEYIGTNHKNLNLKNKDLLKNLELATDARDLPGMADIDSSILLACKEVKKEFTVALSGECSDELFGGYPWYHNPEILYQDSFPWSCNLDARRNLLKPNFLPKGEEYVKERYLQTVNSAQILPQDSPLDKRMRQMFMLNFGWFMQTLLERKDRMSMYNGLEVRVPFCDYRIVEYAYNMPWSIKSSGGREKGILRTAFKGTLPEVIIERKKSPYPKTHNPAYTKFVGKKVKKMLKDKNSLLATLVNKDYVKKLLAPQNNDDIPWYGQLMKTPQTLAYLLQIDHFFKSNKIKLV